MTIRIILGPHVNSEENAIIHMESGENLLKSAKIGYVRSIKVGVDDDSKLTTAEAYLWVQRIEAEAGNFTLMACPPGKDSRPKAVAKIIFADGQEWDVAKDVAMWMGCREGISQADTSPG